MAFFVFLLLLRGSALALDQEGIGQLEGEDFTVRGQVSLATVEGRSVAILASGNEVNVRRGAAQLRLLEGGEITFCGPMTVSLLKGSSGLTLALGAGQLYLRLPRPILVNLYTPQFVIGLMESLGNEREVALALDATGTLNIKAVRGSVTLREQLGAGALVVPEGAEWQIRNGRLQSADAVRGACTCSPSAFTALRPEAFAPMDRGKQETQAATAAGKLLDMVQTAPETSPEKGKESSPPGGLASPLPAALGVPRETPRKEPPPVEWQVIMPPLVYVPERPGSPVSGSPAAAGGGPSTEDLFPLREAIAMAKELRLQPAMFIGQVMALPVPERQAQMAGATGASPADVQSKSAKKGGGLGAKLKSFFRRLFGGSRS